MDLFRHFYRRIFNVKESKIQRCKIILSKIESQNHDILFSLKQQKEVIKRVKKGSSNFKHCLKRNKKAIKNINKRERINKILDGCLFILAAILSLYLTIYYSILFITIILISVPTYYMRNPKNKELKIIHKENEELIKLIKKFDTYLSELNDGLIIDNFSLVAEKLSIFKDRINSME